MKPMEYMNLLAVKAEMDKCSTCAACQAGCPLYENTLSETSTARGRIRMARAVMDGRLDLSVRMEDYFNFCLSCMSCSAGCPSGVDVMKVFAAARAEIAETRGLPWTQRIIFRHILPYPRRLNLLAKAVGLASLAYEYAPRWIAKVFPFAPGGVRRVLPGLLRVNLRSRLAESHSPNPAKAGGSVRKVAYFSGCMTDLAYPETGVSVAERLKEAGIEVVFPKAQVCCGAPAFYSGDMETTRKLARVNMDAFAGPDIDAIVVSCATCGSTLSHGYMELFPDDERARAFASKIVDFQQLLIELSVEKLYERREGQGKKLKVTYHDPCHLRRGMGVSEQPRTLIKSLPNVEFVEMDNADMCCGGSGTFALKYYDKTVEFGRAKAEAIEKSGADIVVTSCPSCQLQLADAINRHGGKTPVMHTADLVDHVLPKGWPQG